MVLGKCSLCGNARSDHEQMYLPSAVTLLSRFVRDVRNNSTNLFQTIYPTNNSSIAPTIPLQVCAWRGCGTQWTFDDSPSLKTLSTARGEANKEQRTIQTISKTIIFQRVLDSFHFVSRTSYTRDLLCMHAQHSCACSGPGTPGARDPKKARSHYSIIIIITNLGQC